ncbi:MAG TPA: LanC-like protein [Solirubrobacteraceae bacterium]|nr:LanC-like protein [Solirubrobacteraceae bacterium]
MELWRASEHEPLTAGFWTAGWAQEALDEIVADAQAAASREGVWPVHPRDEIEPGETWSGLYLGTAGMAWGLWKLGSTFDAAGVVARALERYRMTPDFRQDPHPPSLLCGETGILAAAERVGSPAADSERLREMIRANRSHPTWELLWGSPGTMLAARALGLDEEWRDSAELLWAQWDEETDLWTQDMYGSVNQFLGPGHGFAANVHALRGFVSDDVLRERVARLMERMAMHHDGLVNWPPIPDVDPARIRVQWCHGAPGIVTTIGDLLPWELALAAGELTWRAGPLRKGPGLCHGTAGNGFAFLRLHALTGDGMWLDRARRFAAHAVDQVRRERAAVGHGRYSLFTGDIGVALYLRACLNADPAFPVMDVL